MANISRQMKAAEEWGEAWQVTFAPDKTHAMAAEGQLRFEGEQLSLQILGVMDRELRYGTLITSVARQTS
ncbi:hypothetical protein E2C01_006873 [Portunus trituberculatus]|uniref:Uncharacterized protein n=1 Tax=Portunus trituberculatus TaxID=210409 RepID=A0A5B7CXG7_PORTR|nr:hypothetical protein [Portunus trituberculatus]